MNIAIRADASDSMGSGHVMRCLTLAEACRHRGASVKFICRNHLGNLVELIRQHGFGVAVLPAPSQPPRAEEHTWLGVSLEKDAADTVRALLDLGGLVDWLVVDQYGIDAQWERQMRPGASRIMVIDDLADRPHDCDLLLDQNFRRTQDDRYARLVPQQCRLALGTQYALLQGDYAIWRSRVAPRQTVRRVLVYFGGADAAGLTGKAVGAALSISDLAIDAVVSGRDLHLAALRQLAESEPRLRLHTGLPTLAPLLAEADLAIGAFGATSWERLCLGLPTIAVSMAANQVDVANELSAADLAVWAGPADMVTQDYLARLVQQVMQRNDLANWSKRSMAICDGQGAGRVTDMLWTNNGYDNPLSEDATLGHV